MVYGIGNENGPGLDQTAPEKLSILAGLFFLFFFLSVLVFLVVLVLVVEPEGILPGDSSKVDVLVFWVKFHTRGTLFKMRSAAS